MRLKRNKCPLFALAAMVLGLALVPIGLTQTLQVYDLAGSVEAVTNIDPLVAQFEEENPGLDVQVIRIPHQSFYDRLVIVISSPNPPDIIRFQVQTHLVPFANAGLLMPLENCLEQSAGLNASDWFNPELVAWNEQIWGVPFAAQGRAIAYNKAVYEELGLSIPTTWDELLENVSKTTRDTNGDGAIDQFGWVDSLVNDAWVVSQFGNFMVMNDADLVSEDLTRATAADDAFVQALEYYAELNKKYGLPNPNVITHQQMATAFADGTAVHAVMGSWWPESYAAIWGPDFEYGEDWSFFTNPAGPQLQETGVSTASNFGTWAWGISAKTENIEAACQLLEAIGSPEGIATYNTALPTGPGQLAATTRWDEPFYRDFTENVLEAGVARPAVRGFEGVVVAQQYLTDAVHSAILSDRDVREIANELQRKVQELLD